MQNNFFSDKPAQVGRNMFIFSGNWIYLYPLQHYRDEKQMENNEQKAPFSPILIMEFIRQTTVARCLTNENPMKPQLHRIFRFSYIRDCTRIYHVTIPAKFDASGCKSHAPDCDVTDIVRILPTLKILSRKVFENHLYAYAVVAVQDDFSVLPDCFHNKNLFL